MIIHMAEMLNAECLEYKIESMKEVVAENRVRIHAHDCNCFAAPHFEGVYCEACFVDSWHVKKHVCDKQLYDPAHKQNAPIFEELDLNSEYAEQSWRKFNAFAAITRTMTRAHFRCFLRHLCVWRNRYYRATHRCDINPSRSKKMLKRLRILKAKRADRLRRLRRVKKATGARKTKRHGRGRT